MRTIWLLLALAGCAGAPAGTNAPSGPAPSNEVRAQLEALEAPFRAPGTIVAQLDETVRLGNVEVRPLEILEDSRCPLDVTCVWAGRIRVRVAVTGVGEPVMQLNHPVPLPGGGALVMTAVAPARWTRPPPGVDPNAPPRFAYRRD